jgi:hypothetical protein
VRLEQFVHNRLSGLHEGSALPPCNSLKRERAFETAGNELKNHVGRAKQTDLHKIQIKNGILWTLTSFCCF